MLKRHRDAFLIVALGTACAGESRQDADRDSGVTGTGSAGTEQASRESRPMTAVGPLSVGIAVVDTAGKWCGMFRTDSARVNPGDTISIVFVDSLTIPAVDAVVRARRAAECYAPFAQPGWYGYAAYDLEWLPDYTIDGRMPLVGLAIGPPLRWSQVREGASRVTSDSNSLTLRRCAAHEGEHFTLWSNSPDGKRTRVWHEYYDWGAFVERTCGPGEDGVDSTTTP